jgi:glycine betaine/proline transport system substrate-binding protein
MGAYDMYQLEEPEYTPECEEALGTAIADDADPEDAPKEAGCAYQEYAIHKAVHPSLQERAPEVVEFLKKMNIGTAPLNATAAYMEQEDVEADEAALFFFKTYPDRWRSWLPEDVAVKIEKALADEGVTF